MAEHDQRFKALLREFFPEFLRLFFPGPASRLDLARPEWLDKELLPQPPQGDVLLLDLVARVPRLGQPAAPGEPGGAVALVHIEVESRDAVAGLRRRMFEYYEVLRRIHDEPVLPIAVYLRVGLEGVGIDVYTEEYDGLEVLRFQFYYVGLPALDAERFVSGDNLLGVGLSALMQAPEAARARLGLQALYRVMVESGENAYRKHLLGECLQAYLALNEEQGREYERLKQTEPFKEIDPMITSTADMLLAKGREQGLVEGQRRAVRNQLEHLFGPLSPVAVQRLETLPPDQLAELELALLKAPSLKALKLED